MVVYKLVTELDGTLIHCGTKSECLLILSGLVAYGVREDKFLIVEV